MPTPKVGVLTYFLVENCMKMKKEFGPWGRPWRPLRSATGLGLITVIAIYQKGKIRAGEILSRQVNFAVKISECSAIAARN